jgi:hypothetical protein
LSIDKHRARATLGFAAAELGVAKAEVVAQRVEKRHIWIRFERVRLAIDVDCDALCHGVPSIVRGAPAAIHAASNRLRFVDALRLAGL